MTRTFSLALAILTLSACGLQGDLKRPDPLWGNPALDGPTDPRVIRQLEEEERIRAEQEAAAEEAARQAEIDAARAGTADTAEEVLEGGVDN